MVIPPRGLDVDCDMFEDPAVWPQQPRWRIPILICVEVGRRSSFPRINPLNVPVSLSNREIPHNGSPGSTRRFASFTFGKSSRYGTQALRCSESDPWGVSTRIQNYSIRSSVNAA